MSRRTRTKIRRDQHHFGFGTHHHKQYASSNSHFPKSYSALGKQIKFPTTAVSFLSQGKLTFFGDIDNFQNKISKLEDQELKSIHTVIIGIKGKIQQKMSQINTCIFAFSMIACCISKMFTSSTYRNKFYTRYSFDFDIYKKIIKILQKMQNLQSVIFTFQDNFLTKQKLAYLDLQLSKMLLRSLTLRNLTYFMWPDQKISTFEEQIDQFHKIKKSGIQFIFVWQKKSIKYNSKEFDEQKQSMTSGLCDQI